MNDLNQHRAGLLFGSFTADALSLGVHWIYDNEKLSRKFGYISDYHAPGEDSYHPKKRAGDQSHVGDQACCLASSLLRNHRWEAARFMQDWLMLWPNYGDYFDHATKATLQNIEAGKPATAAASDSEELAGAARIAPLLAFLADRTEDEVVAACVEQTLLTHASEASREAAIFLAIAGHRLMHGAELDSTLRTAAPSWALRKAESVLALDAVEAIGQLGQSCPITSALPAVIYLVLKHGDDLPKAFSENAMAGGDNCARGLALGLLLGAFHGASVIPEQWQTKLTNGALLSRIISV